MRQYTERELYDFVGRADTHEKIAIAAKFIRRLNVDNDLYDDLMRALSYQSRELYYMERYESREHSAACPWNAAGMRPTDFYR